MTKHKLFCFPYAGGSSAVYSGWKQHLNDSIELIPIELAGRGRRIQEELYTNVDELLEDVYRLIDRDIHNGNYSFFGHSMGAMIAYEMTQKIVSGKAPEPSHIFFSGRGAPHIQREEDKKYHLLDDDSFKKQVMELGGTPPEFFEHEELMEMFLPLLKNDFKLSEENRSDGDIKPLDIDITAFFGKSEDLSAIQCDGWKKHTNNRYNAHYFDGGHFFIHTEFLEILRIIDLTLNSNIKKESYAL